MKIIQVENASLMDLANVFLMAVRGCAVPAGTVVLLNSVSHLAAVGAAGYAEDLVRAFADIRNKYGSGITVMHGVPFLMGGLTNTDTIRDMLEIDLWYNTACKSDTMEMAKTRALFKSTLIREGTDASTTVSSAPEGRILMLPPNLRIQEKFSFRSRGFGSQSNLCLPLSEAGETDLLMSLISELNPTAGLSLSEDFTIDRLLLEECERADTLTLGKQMPETREKIILLGGSHSGRACFEFDTNRYDVKDLSVPGWCISEENVEERLTDLKEEVLARTRSTPRSSTSCMTTTASG